MIRQNKMQLLMLNVLKKGIQKNHQTQTKINENLREIEKKLKLEINNAEI